MIASPVSSRIAGRLGSVAAGLIVDRALGEPPSRLHPVAWFGAAMERVEGVLWADRRGRGVGHAAIGVSVGWLAGSAIRSTTAAVALSVAGRALRSAALQVEETLQAGDVERARAQLPTLVGRDPSDLDASGISAAVIESVAENTVDAVVAPVFWAVVAGAPGTLAHRAVNTMDAMVGHRSERYHRYGWAAARLDDVANYVPARIFASLVAVWQLGEASRVIAMVRRDASAHPSPNAGVAETAVAAALGVELGGPLRYRDRREMRPTLGDGPRPVADDIGRAVALVDRVEIALGALLILVALGR